MATESAMRMVESDRARKWPSSKDTAMFSSPLKDMAVEELGFLLKRQGLDGDHQTEKIPSRSGSAPPSMEGSFAAIRNLLAKQETKAEVLSRAIEKYDSEEAIRSDPAYLAYYFSNINLNPRLPPPLVSRENHHLVHHFGGFGDNLRSTSWDNFGNKSLNPSRSALSTHKEEPEDEVSVDQSFNNWAERNTLTLTGRHKSLVDLIQEDFPRTPSPVYNQSRSSSSHPTAEEQIDHDANAIQSEISSENIPQLLESDLDSVDICGDTNTIPIVSNKDPFMATVSISRSFDVTRNSPNSKTDSTSIKGTSQEDDPSLVYGTSQLDISRMRKNQEENQSYGRKFSPQYMSSQHPVQVGQVQPPLLGYPKPSSTEVQQPLQPPCLAPPMYTTAAYMTSPNQFYPNFQPSGLYPPQYNFGGYPPGSTLIPPYMTGYPSHGTTVPVPFEVSSGSSYNTRLTGVSTGQNVPPLMDPFQVQYFQHHLGDAYGASLRYGLTGSNGDSFSQKDPASAFVGDQKLLSPTSGSLGWQSPRHLGLSASSYYGMPPCIRAMQQYPASPLASPVLPSSPVGGLSNFGRRNEMRYPQGSSRNAGLYPSWQGQRGVNSVDDLKRHSFLEELKSTSACKFELSDIAGRIVEFSIDQHGSRFIQQKVEHCSDEEKASVFSEILPHASKLMTDVFGNYVIQKFLEHGSSEQRKELAGQLVSQMVPLSLQMYGCRVIQKALEVIELDQKTELVHELDGHVMRCVRDQNGNHVIQKCIECVPTDRIGFIISAFRGQVSTLSTHPYGCRVIQRVLEHCSEYQQTQCIVDEILESVYALAHDQYGNYVTQHVLERGKPHERSQIISKLTGNIVQMSQHKYASNVVEKCLEHSDSAEQEILIEEIIGNSEEDNHLLVMMKDQFANYVVQKVLEISHDKQREVLLDRIKVHLQALRKYTYGKHIVARFEQLFGEDLQASEGV